jgi:hypothetical protein
MSRKNVFITIVVVLIGAAVVAANVYYKKDKGLVVTTDVIKARDLEAVVSASGKIQPKRLVKISAETSGRVVNLAVNEGERSRSASSCSRSIPSRCSGASRAVRPRSRPRRPRSLRCGSRSKPPRRN